MKIPDKTSERMRLALVGMLHPAEWPRLSDDQRAKLQREKDKFQ